MRDAFISVIVALLSGGLISGLVLAYRARADRDTVVATGAEAAVVSMTKALIVAEKQRDDAVTDAQRQRSLREAAEAALEVLERRFDSVQADLNSARLELRRLRERLAEIDT